VIIESIKEEMANHKIIANSLGAFALTVDAATIIIISLYMFPIFIISDAYYEWKEFDRRYGDEGEEKMQQRKVESTKGIAIAHSSYESRVFDHALATVDLKEIDQLLESGSWLTSLLVAVENLPVCVSLASASENRPGFPLIYVNKYFEKITGYNRSEIIGQNCRFLQAGKSEQDCIDRLSDALRNAKPIRLAITNFRKDGIPFKNLLAMKPIMDENGKYRYVVGVQFDVTQDAATPTKLKLAEEVMRMMPNVILCNDDDDNDSINSK
jgi:PAS domain S-box-containing protein